MQMIPLPFKSLSFFFFYAFLLMFVFASAETHVQWIIPLNVRSLNCPPSKDAKAITNGRKVNHHDTSSLWSGYSTRIVKEKMQNHSYFDKC